jgi:hypothetical protein
MIREQFNDEGVILRVVHARIKEFGETKKSKDGGEFAMALCEDVETAQEFNLIMGLEAFAELKENDEIYLKYFYAKPDKYREANMMVLSKGKHGQMLVIPKRKGE